jgi:hypothetical protein
MELNAIDVLVMCSRFGSPRSRGPRGFVELPLDQKGRRCAYAFGEEPQGQGLQVPSHFDATHQSSDMLWHATNKKGLLCVQYHLYTNLVSK